MDDMKTARRRPSSRASSVDRQVVVPLPDIRGREQILLVHMRKVPLSPDVKAEVIARGTPGGGKTRTARGLPQA